MPFRSFLAAALLALAIPAHATPQARDATDMWFNPAESGWGVNIIHQGDTLFATLFVYGQDGQPKWFVASDLRGGPTQYGGTLYEQTGPAFTVATFDPNAVTRRAVGTMTFTLGDGSATLDYTVDNVHVTKQVSRFSFAGKTIGGTYLGYIDQPSGRRELTMSISNNGSTFSMSTQDGAQGSCTWSGTRTQDGQYYTVAGNYTCSSRSGTWSMTYDPEAEGFTGTINTDGTTGRIAAATRASNQLGRGYGWRNEMWFVPAESGWGFNTIEQDETHFATLFVYDAQGRPRWYVASNLAHMDGAFSTVIYDGNLYERTGPFYGAATFNPSAVTLRSVGGVGLETRDDGSATLSFNIDGAQVRKVVTRFAFRKNDFTGTYAGHRTVLAANTYEALTITIDDGSGFSMRTVSGSSGATCTYTAPFDQLGHFRRMSGTYTCSDGALGTFHFNNAVVTANGFTARIVDSRGVILLGYLAGVRTGG